MSPALLPWGNCFLPFFYSFSRCHRALGEASRIPVWLLMSKDSQATLQAWGMLAVSHCQGSGGTDPVLHTGEESRVPPSRGACRDREEPQSLRQDHRDTTEKMSITGTGPRVLWHSLIHLRDISVRGHPFLGQDLS